jgi:crotonobetainyl-CoA:carnitine CoA-transferase CaiB-like acyl-CoA transferase
MAALGITAGLLRARATGEGQFLDVAMYDALLALCEAIVYRYSYSGVVSRPTGSSHPQLSPFDIYPTADGHCAIAAPTSRHWEILCEIMGRGDLIDDDRTRTNNDRVQNGPFVREAIMAWTRQHATADIVEQLGGIVPVGPVNDAAAIFADPHVQARRMLVAVDQPGAARPVVLPNSPIKYTATPAGVYRRAPKLGEHTAEVLAELYAEEQK